MRVGSTWFTTGKMMKAIGLGANVYEREVLRMIFLAYYKGFWNSENKRESHILCFIKYDPKTAGMGRGSFHKALKNLQERGIIQYRGRAGSKGGHDVSIITPPIVKAICHDFKAIDILNDDTPIGL